MERNLASLEYRGFDRPRLFCKFSELELNSFITKFNLTASESSAEKKEEHEKESIEYREVSADELLCKDTDVLALQLTSDGIYINIKEENLLYRGSGSAISELLRGKKIICYDAKAIAHRLSLDTAIADSCEFLDLSLYAYVLNPGGKGMGVNSLLSAFAGIFTDNGAPCAAHLPTLEKNHERARLCRRS